MLRSLLHPSDTLLLCILFLVYCYLETLLSLRIMTKLSLQQERIPQSGKETKSFLLGYFLLSQQPEVTLEIP